jgi:hypothetical protein
LLVWLIALLFSMIVVVTFLGLYLYLYFA